VEWIIKYLEKAARKERNLGDLGKEEEKVEDGENDKDQGKVSRKNEKSNQDSK